MFIVNPGEFYYHYKRDKNKNPEDHAYYILGIAQDTEDRTKFSVIYKPLYFCDPRKEDETGVTFHSRPYNMFIEMVYKSEYTGLRFTKIIDPKLIEYLKGTVLFQSAYIDQ